MIRSNPAQGNATDEQQRAGSLHVQRGDPTGPAQESLLPNGEEDLINYTSDVGSDSIVRGRILGIQNLGEEEDSSSRPVSRDLMRPNLPNLDAVGSVKAKDASTDSKGKGKRPATSATDVQMTDVADVVQPEPPAKKRRKGKAPNEGMKSSTVGETPAEIPDIRCHKCKTDLHEEAECPNHGKTAAELKQIRKASKRDRKARSVKIRLSHEKGVQENGDGGNGPQAQDNRSQTSLALTTSSEPRAGETGSRTRLRKKKASAQKQSQSTNAPGPANPAEPQLTVPSMSRSARKRARKLAEASVEDPPPGAQSSNGGATGKGPPATKTQSTILTQTLDTAPSKSRKASKRSPGRMVGEETGQTGSRRGGRNESDSGRSARQTAVTRKNAKKREAGTARLKVIDNILDDAQTIMWDVVNITHLGSGQGGGIKEIEVAHIYNISDLLKLPVQMAHRSSTTRFAVKMESVKAADDLVKMKRLEGKVDSNTRCSFRLHRYQMQNAKVFWGNAQYCLDDEYFTEALENQSKEEQFAWMRGTQIELFRACHMSGRTLPEVMIKFSVTPGISQFPLTFRDRLELGQGGTWTFHLRAVREADVCFLCSHPGHHRGPPTICGRWRLGTTAVISGVPPQGLPTQ